ncbi:hypothetical protein [Pectobacterium versatile]|uniref:hypothetical protein n=1 Tax=Pectobacterium versatile TaxID=2488639 RepID=UPI001B37734D|nr:hypothetical protein [Pectobacterium versatile]MBQ4777681.1 hypothetical protein [Pectobacterium versatile]
MERHIELQNKYYELERKSALIEKEMIDIRNEWRISGLANVGLKAGDIVEDGGVKYVVDGMHHKPSSNHFAVEGRKIKKDGTPYQNTSYIGSLTSEHKVK